MTDREMTDPFLIASLGVLDRLEIDQNRTLRAFALLRTIESRQTRQGQTYCDVVLADVDASFPGKIWDDASEALATARTLPRNTPVKVQFRVARYQGRPQLTIEKLRAACDEDEGFDRRQLYGDVPPWLPRACCRTLVFDIETVPDGNIRDMPATIVKALTEFAERRDMDECAVRGLSPFFGKIVSLAFGEGDGGAPPQELAGGAEPSAPPPELAGGDELGGGAQELAARDEPGGEEPSGRRPGSTPGDDLRALVVPRSPDDAIGLPDWATPVSEPELLQCFWSLAAAAETVVTFNGRGFDVPFLVARSLVHGIPARVDLLSNRFGLRPHLDLFDILGQRGRGPSNLDVVCWALGIESPKGAMDGSMVAPAWHAGRIAEIATYNREDVRATRELFRRTRDQILRFRTDW